jgi:cytochrome c
LLQKHACTTCHGIDRKIVGPSFADIAKKYPGRADAAAYLAGKIKAGGSGVWGSIPMPAQALPEADARAIARWLATGAAK